MDWLIWRPVIRRVATLDEILNRWDLSRLLQCHRALNVQDEIDREARKLADQKGPNR